MGTMSFQIGDTVGDYKIAGVVGSGGMGQVFKVEHAVTGRVEAMKVLAGYGEDDSEESHRSLREIQIQAKLDHPNIVAVHNAFRRNDHLVMIMESGYALDSRRPHTLWSATAATAPSRGHRAAVVGPIAAAHCAPRGDGSG